MSVSQNIPVQFNPFSLDDLYQVSSRNLPGRLTLHAIKKALGLDYLAIKYDTLPTVTSPHDFVQQSFATLGLSYEILSGSIHNIPQMGPTIVVANHPFGAIEGMLMVELLLQRRNDVRIIANSFLKRVPELSELFIGVNPYGTKNSTKENFSAMRDGLRWLQQGGVLVMFPAGDVSSIQFKDMAINDGTWDSSVARLAMRTEATIVPMHFEGYNSMTFYLASLLHPILKTALLARQLINKRGKIIGLHIGKSIGFERIRKLKSDTERAAYMRLRSYLLARKTNSRVSKNPALATSTHAQQVIIQPIAKHNLKQEINHLPTRQLLLESGNLQVFHASANQIPLLLQEIGRLREVSFRAVGEGTGKEMDIDLYDSFYQHLFIWDKEATGIVGGYRLGMTDEIMHKYGRSGLYSYSLFKYKRGFLHNIYPAIELGRSFIRPEYQRSFAPLMMLWKGIGRYVAKHPQYAILFGPVSISNDYSPTSQQLLIDYLTSNVFENRLKKQVKPRNPYQKHSAKLKVTTINQTKTIEEISDLISDIESDAKGMPVLIRQYLKLGGRMLGFNVDQDFSSVVDGLIRVDLRQTDHRILSKYMGEQEATAFLEYHTAATRKTG